MAIQPTQATSEGQAGGHNGDYAWDEFDSGDYYQHNYAQLRDDDRQIVKLVADFFEAQNVPAGARGIDVGTGPNLYPALTMLPFCDHITLYEYSASNIRWLTREKAAGWPSWEQAWQPFWDVLGLQPPYRDVAHPRDLLTERTIIRQGSIFDLNPDPAERYQLGTMFFVAESITPSSDEFRSAVDCFLDALAPGAPFAVAFMENSQGYHVGDLHFPATSVGKDDVRERLQHRVGSESLRLEHIDYGDNPLRDGYSGMMVATGLVDG